MEESSEGVDDDERGLRWSTGVRGGEGPFGTVSLRLAEDDAKGGETETLMMAERCGRRWRR